MDIKQTLKHYGLRITENRQKVLDLFQKTAHALSQGVLEEAFPEIDRVSLYRVLKNFEQAGLIHRIADDREIIQYALCRQDCDKSHLHQAHEDNHLHFRCESCEKTFCLDVRLPAPQLPQGYQMQGYQVFAKGRCEKCL